MFKATANHKIKVNKVLTLLLLILFTGCMTTTETHHHNVLLDNEFEPDLVSEKAEKLLQTKNDKQVDNKRADNNALSVSKTVLVTQPKQALNPESSMTSKNIVQTVEQVEEDRVLQVSHATKRPTNKLMNAQESSDEKQRDNYFIDNEFEPDLRKSGSLNSSAKGKEVESTSNNEFEPL